jgi:small subunit ribosomal protein S9
LAEAEELEPKPVAETAPPAAAAPVAAAPVVVVEPVVTLNPNFTRAYGTGRRKEAVARVYLLPGTGKCTVNKRTVEDFFPRAAMRFVVLQPLNAAKMASLFDVRVTVRGGGPMGQAGAVRLGIARALLEYNIELRKLLKKAGFLTRDSRVHERKKYGQKGARKRFQFSKR